MVHWFAGILVRPKAFGGSKPLLEGRRTHASVGSGAPPGTMFHWYVTAHQRVRKVDEDKYRTFMEPNRLLEEWDVGELEVGEVDVGSE